jgi:hypothetical protein
MYVNWIAVGDKIFGILKGSGFRLQMFDKSGKKTLDPHEAARFFATIPSQDPELREFNILISVHDENTDSHVDIKTPNLKNEKDFETVRRINTSIKRNVGDREGISINWFKFDHAIKPKHEAHNNIVESKDISRPFGSTKSSYQRIGNSKLIIRHDDVVDESKQGSRWRHIKSIFIETKLGERFIYPHAHVAGARAMARHLSNDGSMNDEIGEAIKCLSSDYMDLKKGSRLLRRAGDDSKTGSIKNILREINQQVRRLCGPRGYETVSPTLVEREDVNPDEISEIHADLCETCGCDRDSDPANILLVASRYLAGMGDDAQPEIRFMAKPDLVSRAAELPDQKQRLAWQIDEMSGCVADDDTRHRLASIAQLLKAGEVIEPEDLDVIRRVFRASLDPKNHGPVPEIQRIKSLGGV